MVRGLVENLPMGWGLAVGGSVPIWLVGWWVNRLIVGDQ